MEDENTPEISFVYITGPDGKTHVLDAKAEPIEWPGTEEQKSNAEIETKTYSATLTFKLGKRKREQLQWALNGCKTRKEYRRFKKFRKRMLKHIDIINKMKDIDNPKKVKSLEWLKKVLIQKS